MVNEFEAQIIWEDTGIMKNGLERLQNLEIQENLEKKTEKMVKRQDENQKKVATTKPKQEGSKAIVNTVR